MKQSGRQTWSFSEMETARFFLPKLANDEPCDFEAIWPEKESQAAFIQWLLKNELGAFAYLYFRHHQVGLAPELEIRLAEIYWESLAHTAVYQQLLGELTRAFTEQGIPFVLLKGAAMKLTVYTDTAVRQMGDLDIWIQHEDLTTVWKVMHELGYTTDKLWASPDKIPQQYTQVAFYGKKNQIPVCVEAHWDLVMWPSLTGTLTLQGWWERAWQRSLGDQTVSVLDPSAALQHACVHQILKHRGEIRLRWLLDIDRIIRGHENYQLSQADWLLVERESQQSDTLPAIQKAIKLTQRWFDTPLPEMGQTLLNRKPTAVQNEVYKSIVLPHRNRVFLFFANVQETRGWRSKFTLIRDRLLPPPAYMIQRYNISPKFLLPFYYIWRFFKGGKMVLSALFKNLKK